MQGLSRVRKHVPRCLFLLCTKTTYRLRPYYQGKGSNATQSIRMHLRKRQRGNRTNNAFRDRPPGPKCKLNTIPNSKFHPQRFRILVLRPKGIIRQRNLSRRREPTGQRALLSRTRGKATVIHRVKGARTKGYQRVQCNRRSLSTTNSWERRYQHPPTMRRYNTSNG